MKLVLLSVGLLVAWTLSGGELGEPRDVTFQAQVDGSTQRYVERLPVPFAAEEVHHLMIALHGHGSDRWQFAQSDAGSAVASRAVAAKYGMIFVSPDYRAKTSWMGPLAEADVLQIIRTMRDRYRIGDVFLVGGSMGATSALTFTARHPGLVAGVVACNGLANHLEYENFQDAIAASFGGNKQQVPLEYKQRSAEYYPEAFTMPVAFTTGGQDRSVPPESVTRLANVLKKLDRRVLLIHRPEGGHSTTVPDATAALEFVVQEALGLGVEGGGVFFAGQVPASDDAAGHVEVGLRLAVQAAGLIRGLWFYQARSETGEHVLHVWDAEGRELAQATVPAAEGPAWRYAELPVPLGVAAGQKLVLSYTADTHYVATPEVFVQPVVRAGITAEAGVYSFDELGKMPTKTYRQMSYLLDLVYERSGTE